MAPDPALRRDAAARRARRDPARAAHLRRHGPDAGDLVPAAGVAGGDPVPARVRLVLLRLLRRAQPEPVAATAAHHVLGGVAVPVGGAADRRAAGPGDLRADLRRLAHPAAELRLRPRACGPERPRARAAAAP